MKDMKVAFIVLAIWFLYCAYFLWWAFQAKSEWKMFKSYPRGLRLRAFLTPYDRWIHEMPDAHKDVIGSFIQGMRWRYFLCFIVFPVAFYAILWASV